MQMAVPKLVSTSLVAAFASAILLPGAVAPRTAAQVATLSGGPPAPIGVLQAATFTPGAVRVEPAGPVDAAWAAGGAMIWTVRHRIVLLGPMRGVRTASHGNGVTAPDRGYGWPVKPFGDQHPVRGFFDDPRINHGLRLFHFGIDIASPGGTPVFAVEAGTIRYISPRAVGVQAVNGGHSFGYWHIIPAAFGPHRFVRAHELIGYVDPRTSHLHFAERRGGVYLNPLRRGALTPYVDHRPPTIAEIRMVRVGPHTAGTLDIDVDAFDLPQPRVPGVWRDEPVTPALLRWRVVGEREVGPWHTTADFRWSMLPEGRFGGVYAAATRQNHPGGRGAYWFHLGGRIDVPALRPGTHTLQIVALDTRKNRAFAALPIRVTAGA
jgi:murein DD-endopeptidase MepM/ murein hydrolase activator NlpD